MSQSKLKTVTDNLFLQLEICMDSLDTWTGCFYLPGTLIHFKHEICNGLPEILRQRLL
ncbi:hypothetical protein SAMN04515620_10879 [Collimonas sp. OK607]|nr:hypothetical protein SAMN04515620_10879 [Collimonas sp. OK607]